MVSGGVTVEAIKAQTPETKADFCRAVPQVILAPN